MKIAVEGCCHGELTKIYDVLQAREQETNDKIDLVLICGDFQAIRNPADLTTMSVPEKYRSLGDFHQYYKGEKKAPYLTILIGGNHEASGYMWELYYGGWVCENMYYLGAAGVVNYKGLRIGGISGIYKHGDYYKGHYERFPYRYGDLKTIYHTRHYEVAKLLQIKKPMDVFLSHDWPNGIEQCGDLKTLLRIKPYFTKEVQQRRLGSPSNAMLLRTLKPRWWFAAHLHIGYPATVDHTKQANGRDAFVKASPEQTDDITKFLALDKCLPRRHYLEVIDMPDPAEPSDDEFTYDLEWLAITRAFQPYLSLEHQSIPIPNADELESAIEQERMFLDMLIESNELDLRIPRNFEPVRNTKATQYAVAQNPQTVAFCELIGIENDINPDAPILREEQSNEVSEDQAADTQQPASPAKRQKVNAENEE